VQFEKHLFISYAHIDNQPLTPEQQGWVSRFHSSLEAMLSMRMGCKAEIWRDAKLSGNDIFADEIVRQFPKTAVLLSVLSPRYVESDWCRRELAEFCSVAERTLGLVVENKSRVIKVIKLPIESEETLPALVRDMLGYPFFMFDQDQAPLELDPAYGQEIAQKYNLKVAKLAWDIAQVVKKLTAITPGQKEAGTQSSSKPLVYLAECSYDQREIREAVEMELRLHGYTILPNRQMPWQEDTYVAEVSRMLEKCKLSIHLVGSLYGAVPDGPSQKSTVQLQNELAVQRSRGFGLQRIIWLPEGTQSGNPEQQRFIDSLRRDADPQFGADLITADSESLKGAIGTALKKLEEAKSASDGAATDAKFINLICDERDRKATIPLRKFLKAQGFDVQIPVFEGDAATVRRANEEQLVQCDAAIVFYGQGDEAWKRTVDSDLRKIKAVRRGKPLPPALIYLAEPATQEKTELLELNESNLINGLQGFSEGQMQPFLKMLREV